MSGGGTSKRRKAQERCNRKRNYTLDEAFEVKAIMEKRPQFRPRFNKPVPFRINVYGCDVCGDYHLGREYMFLCSYCKSYHYKGESCPEVVVTPP